MVSARFTIRWLNTLLTNGCRLTTAMLMVTCHSTPVAASAESLICDPFIPKMQNFDFVRVILRQSIAPKVKVQQLRNACRHIDVKDNRVLKGARRAFRDGHRSPFERSIEIKVARGFNDAATKSNLNGDPVTNSYALELRKIRAVEDPIVRLQMVYRLSIQHQGQYMNPRERNKLPDNNETSVSDTLIRAATTGKGGVCRDFAVLLAWSINQVSRDESGNELFSAGTEYLLTHVAVRVKIPRSNHGGFPTSDQFELDPTFYEDFNPLPASHLSLPSPALKEQVDQCNKILACYLKEVEGSIEPETLPMIEVKADNER